MFGYTASTTRRRLAIVIRINVDRFCILLVLVLQGSQTSEPTRRPNKPYIRKLTIPQLNVINVFDKDALCNGGKRAKNNAACNAAHKGVACCTRGVEGAAPHNNKAHGKETKLNRDMHRNGVAKDCLRAPRSVVTQAGSLANRESFVTYHYHAGDEQRASIPHVHAVISHRMHTNTLVEM